jgi:hypothetical protein
VIRMTSHLTDAPAVPITEFITVSGEANTGDPLLAALIAVHKQPRLDIAPELARHENILQRIRKS